MFLQNFQLSKSDVDFKQVVDHELLENEILATIKEVILSTELDPNNPNFVVQIDQFQKLMPHGDTADQDKEFSTQIINFSILNKSISKNLRSFNHEYAISCLVGPRNSYCLSILSQKKGSSLP